MGIVIVKAELLSYYHRAVTNFVAKINTTCEE